MLAEITNLDFGLFYLSVILFVIFETLYASINFFRRPKDYPPGPQWYIPFVGNSRYLRKLSKKLGAQHKAFEFLSKNLNTPIFSLKLGTENVVVALTYPIVKEVYTTEEFEGRPNNFFIRLRTMGTRLGITCTDQEFWKEQRSFVLKQLRNVGYGKSIMHERIQEELAEILGILRSSNEQPVWPGHGNLLATSVINILWTFTTGTKIKRNDERLSKFFDLLEKRSKAFDCSGGLLGHMPWLRFIAPDAIGYSLIKNLNEEFYAFFMDFVDEHLRTFSDENSSDDLIYAFIKEMRARDGQKDSTFTEKQLVMVILDIFLGGAQTTSTAINLTLMIMLIYPNVQRKCHEEIERVLGMDGKLPSYSERCKTPYIEAVLHEVQRYFAFVPVTGPRRTLRDVKLRDYVIPKDTTVLMGLYSALNDETVWTEPRTFNPERFLDENMNIVNTDKLIVFGAGRRRCLGDQLARECIYDFVVGILREFTAHESSDARDKPNMELMPGIVLSPRPYKIVFKRKNWGNL